jgi:hypothetical protein
MSAALDIAKTKVFLRQESLRRFYPERAPSLFSLVGVQQKPWNTWEFQQLVREKFFPEVIEKTRSGFMQKIRFSEFQFHLFRKWFEENRPRNLHIASCVREEMAPINGPDGKFSPVRPRGEDSRAYSYTVTLLDIIWLWYEG